MKKKMLVLAAALTIVAGGFTASRLFAADEGAPGPWQGKIFQRIAEKLNLTADQRTQIRGILAGERGNLQPILSELHAARVSLRESIRASTANEAAVRAASAKVAAAEADLAVERMKLYGKIAPILTDEQLNQLAAFEERTDDLVEQAIARIGEGPEN